MSRMLKTFLFIVSAPLSLSLKASELSINMTPSKCKVYLQINVHKNCDHTLTALGEVKNDNNITVPTPILTPAQKPASVPSVESVTHEEIVTPVEKPVVNGEIEAPAILDSVAMEQEEPKDLAVIENVLENNAEEEQFAENISEIGSLENELVDIVEVEAVNSNNLDQLLAKIDTLSLEEVIKALPDICVSLAEKLDVKFVENEESIEAIVDFKSLEEKKLSEAGIHGNINIGVSKGKLNLSVTIMKEISKFRTPDAPKVVLSVFALRTIDIPVAIEDKAPVIVNEGKIIRVSMKKASSEAVVTEETSEELAAEDQEEQQQNSESEVENSVNNNIESNDSVSSEEEAVENTEPSVSEETLTTEDAVEQSNEVAAEEVREEETTSVTDAKIEGTTEVAEEPANEN